MKKSRQGKKIITVQTPIDEGQIKNLKVGDQIEIQGMIYCGRDAVLPRLARLTEDHDLHGIEVNLKGAVIFHTAVSPSGIGPTTSNKDQIEGSIPSLSKQGVKIHLGKGSLGSATIEALKKHNSVFAVTPPVTALLRQKIISKRIAAFKEEGMEALYELEVEQLPAIIAIAHGESIFTNHHVEGGIGNVER